MSNIFVIDKTLIDRNDLEKESSELTQARVRLNERLCQKKVLDRIGNP